MAANGANGKDEAAEFGVRPALLGVAITGAVLGAGAFALYDARTSVGVLLGGAIATANLWILARVVRAFLGQGGRAAPWAIIAIIKLAAMVLGVGLLLKTDAIPPLALVAGYLSLPIGITLGSLFGPKPPDDAIKDPPAGDAAAPLGDVVEGGPSNDPPAGT